jgi:branched-chain amino acid transport system substrate-binding protein
MYLRTRRRRPRLLRASAGALIILVSAMGIAACGSSSKTAGSASSAESSSAIQITAISDFNSSQQANEDAAAAITAKVDQVNAAGGVAGHPIKLTICNDQFDVNQATTCARNAVTSHAVAVLAPTEAYSAQVLPILQAAGIPYVGNTAASTIDTSNPDAFPLDPGQLTQYLGVATGLKDAGCKKVGAVTLNFPASNLGEQLFAQAVTQVGMKFVLNVSVGTTEPTYAPEIAQLVNAGANCLTPITQPPEAAKVITAAAQSGKHLLIGGISALMPQSLLTSLGSVANGIVIGGGCYLPTDTKEPGVKAMISAMAKYTPSVKADEDFSTAAWGSAVLLFGGVLPSIKGPITSASVLSALEKTVNMPTQTYENYTFAKPAPDPTFPRVRDTQYLIWVVRNGVPVLAHNFTS